MFEYGIYSFKYIFLGVLVFSLYTYKTLIINTNASWMFVQRFPSVVKQNLNITGDYSEKLQVSIKYWIYGIEVLVWRVDSNLLDVVIDNIRKWNDKYNIDYRGIIRDGIEKAHTLILRELEDSRKDNRSPKFKLSEEFDYHICSKLIEFSDYVNEKELISYIDKLLGGDVVENQHMDMGRL